MDYLHWLCRELRWPSSSQDAYSLHVFEVVTYNSRRDLHGKAFGCIEVQLANGNFDSRTKSHFIQLDILPWIPTLCFTEKTNNSLTPAVTQSSIVSKGNVLCLYWLWVYKFIERILVILWLQSLHSQTVLKQCVTLGCSTMLCDVRMLTSDGRRPHIHEAQWTFD